MPGDKLMPLTNYSGKTETEPEGEGCCCGRIRRRRTENLSDAAGNGAIWKRPAAAGKNSRRVRLAVVEKVNRKKKAAAAMPMQMRICWRKHSRNQETVVVAELSPNQNPAAVKKSRLT